MNKIKFKLIGIALGVVVAGSSLLFPQSDRKMLIEFAALIVKLSTASQF